MVKEELVALVNQSYYQQKKSKEEVKEALMKDGWAESDIEAAIVQIRNEALRKLPFFSLGYKIFDSLEDQYSHLSTRAVVIILIVVACWLFLVAFAVYIIYDPLSIKGGSMPIVAPSRTVSGEDISFP